MRLLTFYIEIWFLQQIKHLWITLQIWKFLGFFFCPYIYKASVASLECKHYLYFVIEKTNINPPSV